MRIISRSLEEAEILVAQERAGVGRDFALWRDATKNRVVAQATSLRGIGIAAAVVGLLATVLVKRRPRRFARNDEPAIKPETKRKGIAAILGGLAMTGLRMRYGNPWKAVPVFLTWGRDQYARRYANRPVRTRDARAVPPMRMDRRG
ncbi:hypothetical protein [Aromatoleum sp.]|uniref:hypothetical protein n=1 Tax=Aromatoleum sp. TaxID=2307007 RepID=UPI002FCC0053